MQIIHEVAHEDGSAWVASVRVKGVLYVASYVASTLSVKLGPYKHAPRRPRWAEQSVRTWAEKRVAVLSEAWMSLHRAMYSSHAETAACGGEPCAN
jgi:hypothetical protein